MCVSLSNCLINHNHCVRRLRIIHFLVKPENKFCYIFRYNLNGLERWWPKFLLINNSQCKNRAIVDWPSSNVINYNCYHYYHFFFQKIVLLFIYIHLMTFNKTTGIWLKIHVFYGIYFMVEQKSRRIWYVILFQIHWSLASYSMMIDGLYLYNTRPIIIIILF